MSLYYQSPLALGTRVKFTRSKSQRGQRTDWSDTGQVRKVYAYSYVIESQSGDLFVRSFDEVERINADEQSTAGRD